jgi:hypothetical protein
VRYPLEDDDPQAYEDFKKFLAGQLAYDTKTNTYVPLERAGEDGVVAGGLAPRRRCRPTEGDASRD